MAAKKASSKSTAAKKRSPQAQVKKATPAKSVKKVTRPAPVKPSSKDAGAKTRKKATPSKGATKRASVTSAAPSKASKAKVARAPKAAAKAKSPAKSTVTAQPRTKKAKAARAPAPKAVKTTSKTGKKAAPSSGSGGSTGGVQTGQKAPGFELLDQSGKLVRSSDLAGAPYVLYFYPKDNTPGCTQEACDFRDRFSAFTRKKIRVFGVSPDSAKSHQGFAGKYQLPFPLLVDSDKKLANAYGAWAKKQNYGREYFGIVRSTFVVDADGVVRNAWRGVRVAGHADAVLAAAQEVG